MKSVFKIAALGLFFTLAACSRSNESHSTASTTYQVNGMSPENYFRQFLYRQTGSCRSLQEAHHYAMSEDVKIGVTPFGKDVLANLSLFMKEDGTYKALYQEMIVQRYFPDGGGYYYDSPKERVFAGQWGISGGKLVLSGLGQASALQYNGRPTAQLVVEVDILSAGFKGKTLLIRQIEGSINPIPEIDPCR